MSNVRLLAWNNKWDDASLSSTDDVSNLAVENTQVDPIGLPARTDGTSFTIDFDYGSQTAWRVFALIPPQVSQGQPTSNATVRITLSNSASGNTDVYDSGTINAGAIDGYPEIYHDIGSNKTAQYGRIVVSDSSLSLIEIGRIFAGEAWQPTIGESFGRLAGWIDPSPKTRSLGGQTLIDKRTRFRRFEFQLEFNTESEMMDNAFELDRVNGTSTNVLMLLDRDGFSQKLSTLGLITRSQLLNHWNFDRVRKRYVIEQRL